MKPTFPILKPVTIQIQLESRWELTSTQVADAFYHFLATELPPEDWKLLETKVSYPKI